jgi:hypothetical protein
MKNLLFNLGQSNQEGWSERVVAHVWEEEKHREFWWRNFKEGHHMDDLRVYSNKTDHQEMGWEIVDLIHLAHDRESREAS